jgi:hypothetical protein
LQQLEGKNPGPNASIEKQQSYNDLIDRVMQDAKWALEDAIKGLEKIDSRWLT